MTGQSRQADWDDSVSDITSDLSWRINGRMRRRNGVNLVVRTSSDSLVEIEVVTLLLLFQWNGPRILSGPDLGVVSPVLSDSKHSAEHNVTRSDLICQEAWTLVTVWAVRLAGCVGSGRYSVSQVSHLSPSTSHLQSSLLSADTPTHPLTTTTVDVWVLLQYPDLNYVKTSISPYLAVFSIESVVCPGLARPAPRVSSVVYVRWAQNNSSDDSTAYTLSHQHWRKETDGAPLPHLCPISCTESSIVFQVILGQASHQTDWVTTVREAHFEMWRMR